MSTGLQNFVYNADIDSEEENDNDEVKTNTMVVAKIFNCRSMKLYPLQTMPV